jgi:phage terminase small subunit
LTDNNTALSLPDTFPSIQDQESLFIRNLFTEPSITQAALSAGYSESSAKSHIYTKLRQPKFQERIREYARTHELINSVPTILRLEENALKYLADKPEQLPKFASILKQKKQIAGLLSQDVAPAQATISIGQVSNLMLNVTQHTQDVVNAADNSAHIINVDDK